MQLLWQTYEARENLLKQLVQQQTITNTPGEKTFARFVESLLLKLTYFNQHRELIQHSVTEDDKELLTALYRGQNSNKTIVLLSHFDTVGVDDYATHHQYAFNPDKLQEVFHAHPNYLDDQAQTDLQSDEFLFGRGVMDMKAGLMLHMSLLEKASMEQWDVNLLLVTVPDEEVNSSGMRKVIHIIAEYQQQYDLDIQLHLNSEPTFQQLDNDLTHYVYSGSIGKIMPGVLCFGKETHVGNPLEGLSSNFILSYITQSIEYNARFKEKFEHETTPLPLSIANKDIKENYDVQTPFRSYALYNMFLFQQTPATLYQTFLEVVIKAVERCENDWLNILELENQSFESKINVLTFEQLNNYVVAQHGEEKVSQIIQHVLDTTPSLHMQSIAIADELIKLCREITPAVVTFFAPPFYPAVNSSENTLVQGIVETVKETSQTQFNRDSQLVHYFNGISDSSYVQLNNHLDEMTIFSKNAPSFNRTYTIPFDKIAEISAPVILCGPIGKDAHKVGERVYKKSAFEELPIILETIIKKHFV